MSLAVWLGAVRESVFWSSVEGIRWRIEGTRSREFLKQEFNFLKDTNRSSTLPQKFGGLGWGVGWGEGERDRE